LSQEVLRIMTFFGYFLLILSLFSLMCSPRKTEALALLIFPIIVSILMIIISILIATGKLTLHSLHILIRRRQDKRNSV